MTFWTIPLPGLMRRRGGAKIIGIAVATGQTVHQRISEKAASLSGAQYNLGGAYYSGHAAFALQDEVIDGQLMVRIPAFWYRRAAIGTGPHVGKQGWWVADREVEGFTRHPAFMKDGNLIDHFWIGKYQGTNDGGTKLGSLPGALPLGSLTHSQLKARASARNVSGQSGWMMWSIYQLAAIQMLAMIEMGSTDSQTAIGSGRVGSGSVANVDAADVATATYRGLVGLWGNVNQFIDGIRTVSPGTATIELWNRAGSKEFVSTGQARNFSQDTQVSMISGSGSGYNFGDVFVPNVAGASGGAWPDRAAFSPSFPGNAAIGGNHNSAGACGMWFINCSHSSTVNGVDFASRLAKEP